MWGSRKFAAVTDWALWMGEFLVVYNFAIHYSHILQNSFLLIIIAYLLFRMPVEKMERALLRNTIPNDNIDW